jgi:hypothetical protein
MPSYLTEEARRRLVSNGTHNADGTVNLETAERAGFTRIWAERAQAAREAAESTSHERHGLPSEPMLQRP